MIYFNEMSHSREFSKNGSPKVWYKPLKVGALMSKFKVSVYDKVYLKILKI